MKKGILIISFTTIFIGFLAISKTADDKKKEPEALETQEKAVATINDLIKKNAAFSVKIAHHLLPIKAKLWKQKGILKIPTNITWDVFKKDVYQFGVSLHSLLEKDSKNFYYHMDSLRKDHPLYKLLGKIKEQLDKNFSKDLAEPSLKIEKPQSLQRLINVYAAIFYKEKLISMVADFFKKFEAQAKKMREVEERAQRAAEGKSASYDSFDSYGDMDIDYSSEDFSSGDEDYSFDLGSFDFD